MAARDPDWTPSPHPPIYPGQLVLRLWDQQPLRVLAVQPGSGWLLLEDGTQLPPAEVEDPLWAGRQRDLERGARAEARRRQVEAGDLERLFPCLRASRRALRWRRLTTLLGWAVAAAALLHGFV